MAENFRSTSTTTEGSRQKASAIKPGKVPARARVILFDVEHVVDLEACRVAMPLRIAELRAAGQDLPGRELVAKAANVDPRTLRTFLDGGRVKPDSLIDIIERGLGLKFADIVTPAKVA